ncbi:Flp1 family type IVb pilin [Paenibacillus pinihumi]|uniref:Flp1 family type IVb pilin n=1 Tax=Paenibacillus pinihumi TaxID=669462 RepID=UPI000417487A|nr:Flp1 family type IVb pilin [Paenibacillus pinihumi]
MKSMWAKVKGFGGKLWRSEDGMGTLEIILIIAVLILVALLFKDQILRLVKSLMGTADTTAKTIFN